MKLLFFLFIFTSIGLFTLHTWFSGHAMYGDGNAYFSHAHALAFQGNLDFTSIYHHLSNFPGKHYTFDRIFWETNPTATGRLPNKWLIGPALFWTPFFLLARVVSFLVSLPVSPFSLFWEYLAGYVSLSFALLGLYLLARTLTRVFAFNSSQLALLTLFFGSHLFYYLTLEPTLAHSLHFFLQSTLLYFLFSESKKSILFWTITGGLIGLLAITRPTGALSLLLILPFFFKSFPKPQSLLLFVLAFFVAVMPQALAQQYLYGSFLAQPYLSGAHGNPLPDFSKLFSTLFSAQRGLFIWSPAWAIALIGLFDPRLKRYRNYFLPFIIALYLVVGTWHAGLSASFGNRFYLDAAPLMAFGLAAFYQRHQRHALPLTIFFICWNFALLSQFYLDKPRLVDLQQATYSSLFSGQIIYPLSLLKLLSSPNLSNLYQSLID